MKSTRFVLLLIFALGILASCGGPEIPAPTFTPMLSQPAATATTASNSSAGTPTEAAPLPTEAQAAPTDTSPAPTDTSEPQPTPTRFNAVEATMTAETGLSADLQAVVTTKMGLPTPPVTPTGEMGIEGVKVLPLNAGDAGPLWAVFTYGMRRTPDQNHSVSVYKRSGDNWQQVATYTLQDPDYVDPQGVEQAKVVPGQVWLQIESGVGAHGGCYDLLRLNGSALDSEASFCNSTPGAGSLKDLNGDGVPEVVLDQTNAYVFCYACSVREILYQVLSWDGNRMVEVKLSPLPDSAPADLKKANDRAVELAQAGLWKDAADAIDQAVSLGADNQTVKWNAGLIHLTAEGRLAHTKDNGYPLLAYMFYGDYNAAVDQMRQYSSEELFGGANSPLVKGTPAEGWENELSDWVTKLSSSALQAEPDLAPAYFLRGWGLYLQTPGSADAIADFQKAAQLAPNDELFTRVATYVTNK